MEANNSWSNVLSSHMPKTQGGYESMKVLVDIMRNPHRECIDTKIAESVVRYVLPPLESEKDFSDEDYKHRLERLKTFVRAVLGIPKDEQCVGSVVTDEMSESFGAVVRYFVKIIDHLRPKHKDHEFDQDLEPYQFIPPTHPNQIYLEIYRYPALLSLIGPSKCTTKFYTTNLVQAIRVISILYVVNQHWGSLFTNLTSRQIVPNSAFQIIAISNQDIDKFEWTKTLVKGYPYLFKTDLQQDSYNYGASKLLRVRREPDDKITFTVSRSDTLEIVGKVLSTKDKISYWFFKFGNEAGTGTGPTNEFFINFSKDIQRYDLNLWNGESQLSADGINYVNSPCGLFPSPCKNLDGKSKNILKATGILMAKALLDGRLMNINFSPLLYKYLLGGATYFSLGDLKYVMPSLTDHVNTLVKIMKEVINIKDDHTLTSEEQQRALSDLKYDGCSFEDLCINFTIPGFPDIEMVKGGVNKFLSASNILGYLELLVWWFFYGGPQEKLECLREGFTSVLKKGYLTFIFPEDLERMLCGEEVGKWTVEELRQFVVFGKNLRLENPTSNYLFEVLSSFSTKEQKLFLKFVTGSPNLPVGGLTSLKPRLTIDTFKTVDNPNKHLPKAMTCSNTLIIPTYTSKEALKWKLLQALRVASDYFGVVWKSFWTILII